MISKESIKEIFDYCEKAHLPNEYPIDEDVASVGDYNSDWVEEKTTKEIWKCSKMKMSKLEIPQFLNMDDNVVKNVTSFKHFYIEDDNQYI